MAEPLTTSVFDSLEFSERLFFPRPEASPPPPGARDLFVEVPGARLHMRIHAAPAATRTLLLFHGNGEIVADYDDSAAQFASAGVALAVTDYRGYGQSTGTPSLRAAIADALPVLEAVGSNVVVMGRSLGSACAAELYARNHPAIAGVVLESGFTDLLALIRRRGYEPPAVLDPEDDATFGSLGKLARGTAPLLVLHGANDTMIVPREAEAALAAAGTASKQLVIVPGRGHNDISFSPVYWDALRAFVDSLG